MKYDRQIMEFKKTVRLETKRKSNHWIKKKIEFQNHLREREERHSKREKKEKKKSKTTPPAKPKQKTKAEHKTKTLLC